MATALAIWGTGDGSLLGAMVLDRGPGARVAVGGQYDVGIARGELWRLFTSVLLHGDGLHLLVDGLALWTLGRVLEPILGGRRWLAWALACGVVGSIVSHLAGVPQSDGSSAAAYGLLGVALVLGWRRRKDSDPETRWLMGPMLWGALLVNLLLSVLLPFVDLFGHLGGLGCGLLLGMMPHLTHWSRLGSVVEWLWIIGYTGICGVGWVMCVGGS